MAQLKKIDVRSFVQDIKDNLEGFEEEMIDRNFSNRNDREWFKMLGDYLGLSDFRKVEVDEDED